MRILWFSSIKSPEKANFLLKPDHQVVAVTNIESLMRELQLSLCHLLILHLTEQETALVKRVTAATSGVPTILLTAGSEETWAHLVESGCLQSLTFQANRPDPASGYRAIAGSVPLHQLDVDIRRAVLYIHEHICDPTLSLDRVAAQVPVSRFHFSRLFRKYMGLSFREYVIGLRLDAAKRMLAEQRLVTEVCFAVGYNDLTHFGRIFRKQIGVTPSTYRNTATASTSTA